MPYKQAPQMLSDWESAERAFEGLYIRSSLSLAPLETEEPSQGKTNEHYKPPPVDVAKLSRITASLHKAKTPSSFLDYSAFASANFGTAPAFTAPGSHMRKKSSEKAKLLYNEVQKASVDFGVTPETIKSYHKRKFSSASDHLSFQSSKPNFEPPKMALKDSETESETPCETISDSDKLEEPVSTLKTPQIQTTPPQGASPLRKKRQQSNYFSRSKSGILSNSSSPTGTPITITPRRLTDKLPLEEATDVTKRRGVLLEPFESGYSSSQVDLLTPEKDYINDEVFDSEAQSDKESLSKPESESKMAENPFLEGEGETKDRSSTDREERTPSPNTHVTMFIERSLSTGSSPSLARSRFGSLFKKKQASLTNLPTRKECHSVEDTLLADREFNDFSFPTRRNSYFSKSLEFSFEKPGSKTGSSRSSLLLQSPRSNTDACNRPPSLGSLSTSSYPSPRLQRHSISDFSSTETSPVTPTSRRKADRIDQVRMLMSSTGSDTSMSPSLRARTSFFDPIVENENEKMVN